MKKKKIVVSYILDQSGSMLGYKDLTINTFNEYIQTLKNKKENVEIGLTLFNSYGIVVKHDGVKLSAVEKLTADNYIPDALTPLYDAIGKTMLALEKSHSKDNVLIVIQTDGLENASTDYDRAKIFSMIESKRNSGWEFVFLGANQDAWATSSSLGISAGNTVTYDPILGTANQLRTVTSSYMSATETGSNTSNLLNTNDSQNKKDESKVPSSTLP